MLDREVAEVCAKLYHGWAEKGELPRLATDPVLLRAVQDQLSRLGLELIDRPEAPWYVVRLLREHDSFADFSRRHRNLTRRHLAMLLILYARLLLPRRSGQVGPDSDVSVTFGEIFQNYGHKFVPARRRTATGSAVKQIMSALQRLGFITKQHGSDIYRAGPAMYMLSDELLADVAEASLRTLFALEDTAIGVEDSALAEEDEEGT